MDPAQCKRLERYQKELPQRATFNCSECGSSTDYLTAQKALMAVADRDLPWPADAGTKGDTTDRLLEKAASLGLLRRPGEAPGSCKASKPVCPGCLTSAADLLPKIVTVLPALTAAPASFGLATPTPVSVADMRSVHYSLDALQHFECSACGRYTAVADAHVALSAVAEKSLGGMQVWSVIVAHADRGDLRPATLQRVDRMTYDAAIALIERAIALGLLRRSAGAVQ